MLPSALPDVDASTDGGKEAPETPSASANLAQECPGEMGPLGELSEMGPLGELGEMGPFGEMGDDVGEEFIDGDFAMQAATTPESDHSDTPDAPEKLDANDSPITRRAHRRNASQKRKVDKTSQIALGSAIPNPDSASASVVSAGAFCDAEVGSYFISIFHIVFPFLFLLYTVFLC